MSSEITEKNPNVLIIDDDKIIRDALAKLLIKGGYDNLHFAENGEEGLALVRKVLPVAIILDIHMPVMDGIAFLKELKPKLTDPYLVTVLTAYADNDIMKECYRLGANFFLRKPCNGVELCSVVSRVIELKMAEKHIMILAQQRAELKNELKNKEMEERLKQADKMVSLGTMAAGVAHDVNNPLSVATGDVHLLKRDFKDIRNFIDQTIKALSPEKAREIEKLQEEIDFSYIMENFDKKLNRCEEAMGRLKSIVQNLKDFSKKDEGDIVEIDVNKEIESSLEMVPKKYKKGIEIKTELLPLPTVPCFGRQLGQVFVNLIVNALQAMDGEGMLKIESSSNEDSVLVKICDTGPGIPEDKLKTVFNPFYTTKQKGEGTGLGLSMCKSLLENHNGDIYAENNPEKGVTFTINISKNGVNG